VSYRVNDVVPLPRRLSPDKPTCGIVRYVSVGRRARFAYVEVAGRQELLSFEELDAAEDAHRRELGV